MPAKLFCSGGPPKWILKIKIFKPKIKCFLVGKNHLYLHLKYFQISLILDFVTQGGYFLLAQLETVSLTACEC